jgi:hypothetical protein
MAIITPNRQHQVFDGNVVTKKSTVELFGKKVKACEFCGEDYATAYWASGNIRSLCPTCAVEQVPAFIADALMGNWLGLLRSGQHGHRMHLKDILETKLETVQKNFWKAVASAVLSQGISPAKE